MSGTDNKERMRFTRRVRPRFHKALIPMLIIGLIIAVILIMFLNRYLSKSTRQDDGWLERRIPVVAVHSGDLLKEDGFVLQAV